MLEKLDVSFFIHGAALSRSSREHEMTNSVSLYIVSFTFFSLLIRSGNKATPNDQQIISARTYDQLISLLYTLTTPINQEGQYLYLLLLSSVTVRSMGINLIK